MLAGRDFLSKPNREQPKDRPGEFAIASFTNKKKTRSVFPIVGRDFGKMMIGLSASLAIVLMIHYVIVPNGL